MFIKKIFRKLVQILIWFFWTKFQNFIPRAGFIERFRKTFSLKRLSFWEVFQFGSKQKKAKIGCRLDPDGSDYVPFLTDIAEKFTNYDLLIKDLVNRTSIVDGLDSEDYLKKINNGKLNYQLLLLRACIKGNVQLFELIIEKFGTEKTKLLLEKPIIFDHDQNGEDLDQNHYFELPRLAPIHWAIIFDHYHLIVLLLTQFGLRLTLIDDDFRNSGTAGFDMNPVMFGSLINDRESIIRSYDMILRAYIYGISLDEQTPIGGNTALHMATKMNNFQSVQLLIRLGADRTLKNRRGETAADLAMSIGNKVLYRLLVSDDSKSVKFTIVEHIRWSFRLFRKFSHYRVYVGCLMVGTALTTFELILCFGYLLPLYIFEYLVKYDDLVWIHRFMVLALAGTTTAAILSFWSDPGYFPVKSQEYFDMIEFLIENRLTYHHHRKINFGPVGENGGDSDLVVNLANFDQLEESRRRLGILHSNDLHFCHICEAIVSLDWSQAKHCYICGRCVAQYDHHCIFLFNCIGQRNFPTFIMFNLLFAYVGLSGVALIGIGIQRKLLAVRMYYDDEDYDEEDFEDIDFSKPYEVGWKTFTSMAEFSEFMIRMPFRDFFNMLIMIKFSLLCLILAGASLFRRFWTCR